VKFSKELKVGFLAVVAIAMFVFGYNFLKGKNLFNSERFFYAVYDNVEGLDTSSAVTVNGLKIGKVQDITISPEDGNLLVKFSVENDFQFSKSSIAKVYGGGIIGGKSLAIIPDFDNPQMAESGDMLQSESEEGIMELVNEKLSPLQEKIENAIVSADSLLTSINSVLNDETKGNLKGTIENLNHSMVSFKNISGDIELLLSDNNEKLYRSIDNLDRTAENFAGISDSLAQIQVGKLVDDIEGAIAGFKSVADKINSNEGNLGKLLHDEQLYENIEGATRQLEQLLQDMKLNPKRYVHFSLFGKRNKEYVPPDDPNK